MPSGDSCSSCDSSVDKGPALDGGVCVRFMIQHCLRYNGTRFTGKSRRDRDGDDGKST